ncbi:hypothetical protein CANINC_003037 [Pichia inconspicua]|uniref:Uncharacterized protein n=1 Tax=Pichia inconspicua TaxID=52247 RepID=A0A4T0WZX6_9ASCO|nr:hypothetical protein CANINC_003037 [[Candida] inconspicua]
MPFTAHTSQSGNVAKLLCSLAGAVLELSELPRSWLPGTIHAWYIIATTPIIPINDEENQIFIVTQPNSVVVHSHPYPSRVQFVHPEPFLEDSQHHNTLHNHTTILDRPLSPLSDPPAFLSDYGSNDNNDNIPPPTYDNVMNQTMKN